MFAVLHDFSRTMVWIVFVMGIVSYGERTHAAFTIADASTEQTVPTGNSQAATVAIESNAEMNDVNVQVAVVDATRRVVAKHNFTDTKFKVGETRTFKAKFPSLKEGSYTLSVTILGPDKIATFHFEEDLAKFDVVAPLKAAKTP